MSDKWKAAAFDLSVFVVAKVGWYLLFYWLFGLMIVFWLIAIDQAVSRILQIVRERGLKFRV